jgi:hypothetical protein
MGDCVAACRNIYPNLQALDVAKSLAIRRTLVFAHEESMTNIIIALIAHHCIDCLSMVQRTHSSYLDRFSCASVIEDIKMMVPTFNFYACCSY